MQLIGITGGVGSGKTWILDYIKKHYPCKVYLADEISHGLMKKGAPCYELLVNLLGKEVLGEDGEIERTKMASLIFKDQTILTKVNQILHPAVKLFVKEAIKEAKENEEIPYFFLEAALLIEEKYDQILDELWYIYVEDEIRIKRLMESRNYTREKTLDIMKKQLSKEQFCKHCSVVIDNSKSMEYTKSQIKERLGTDTWQE